MAEATPNDPVKQRELAQKFVQFVMIQAQNILYVLGRIPGPDGMSPPPNLEAAKMLIDQLEVIQAKTKGNLIPQEEKILEEALSSVRMAFVESSGGTPVSMMPDRSPGFDMPFDEEEEELPPEPAPAKPAAAAPRKEPTPAPAKTEDTGTDDDENKKKYFKSYG